MPRDAVENDGDPEACRGAPRRRPTARFSTCSRSASRSVPRSASRRPRSVRMTLRPTRSSIGEPALALELLDLLRHRGRGEVERRGGGDDAAVVADGDQGAERAEVDHEAIATGLRRRNHRWCFIGRGERRLEACPLKHSLLAVARHAAVGRQLRRDRRGPRRRAAAAVPGDAVRAGGVPAGVLRAAARRRRGRPSSRSGRS